VHILYTHIIRLLYKVNGDVRKRGWNTCFWLYFFHVCVPRSRSTFLLDYSDGVDALLLTNPAADRFCVLGRPGRYPDQNKKNTYEKNFSKGVRHVRLFPTRTESHANINSMLYFFDDNRAAFEILFVHIFHSFTAMATVARRVMLKKYIYHIMFVKMPKLVRYSLFLPQ